MGYGRALLQRDVRQEEAALQKKAKKKSLWGSIGRTIGGLGAMALTGGTVNPVTLGLLTGGMSFLGGAAGAKLSKTGDLSKQGKFFKSDRESIQKELGAFGTQNLMSSLKSGLTAGIGQATKLYKAGSRAQELGKSAEEVSKIRKGVSFKEGFGESFAGKGLQKAKVAISPTIERNILSPAAKKMAGDPMGTMKEMQQANIDAEQLDLMSKGKAPGVFKQTTTGNEFIDRSLGRDRSAYTPTTSGVFDVDLEDVEETVSASDILSRKKAAMSQFFEDPKNVKELGLYTGRGPEGYRPTTWRPEAGTDLREFSDKYKTFSNTEIAGHPEWRLDARNWASEATELRSQELQQSLLLRNRLGISDSPEFGLSAGNMYKNKWGR